jgi:hypothetical protein
LTCRGKKLPLKVPTASQITFMDKVQAEVKLNGILSTDMLLDEKQTIIKVAKSSTLTKGRRGKPLQEVVKEMRRKFIEPTSYEFGRLSES